MEPVPSTNDGKTYTKEIVAGTRGSRESLWFFVTVFFIVSTAALLLLSQYQVKKDNAVIPPTSINPLLLQLANARAEIEMLIEMEMLPAQPDLASLKEAAIPPFDFTQFIEPESGCFIASHVKSHAEGESQTWVRFILGPDSDINGDSSSMNSRYQISWQQKKHLGLHDHNGHSDTHQYSLSETNHLCELGHPDWNHLVDLEKE